MTTSLDLTDAQWCFLDLLVRARQKGASRVSRMEILNSPWMPVEARVRLTFAALTIPAELVVLHGQHDFELTDEGQRAYDLRFGVGQRPARPTSIADMVIALPDRSGERLQ